MPHKRTIWRFVIGWTLTSCFLISALFIIWYWMDGNLQDIREDTLQHIEIEYSIPLGHSNDPQFSLFTVTNNSRQVLSSRHRLACTDVRVIGSNRLVIQGLSFVQKSSGGWVLMSGPPSSFPVPEESARIEPGGDSQTQSCLSGFMVRPFTCADIIVTFQYYLEDQPSVLQEKKRRIVTRDTGNGTFEWYKQPLETPGSYCPLTPPT